LNPLEPQSNQTDHPQVTSNGKIAKTSHRIDSSVAKIAEQIGIPLHVVEYRHRIAHNSLPSLEQLKDACGIVLNWLKENYWSRVLKQQRKDQSSLQATLDKLGDVLNEISHNRKRKRANDPNQRPESSEQEVVALMQRLFNASGHFGFQLLAKNLVEATRSQVKNVNVNDLEKRVSEKFDLVRKQATLQESESPDESSQSQLAFSCHIDLIQKDVFERYSRVLNYFSQMSQANLFPSLLASLLKLFDDVDKDVRNTAALWFAQIQIALLNSSAGCPASHVSTAPSTKKGQKKRPVHTQTPCICSLRFDDEQEPDSQWMHVFLRLVDRPSLSTMSLQLARNFSRFVEHAITADQFERIVLLNAIYVGAIQPTPSRALQVSSLQNLTKCERISSQYTSGLFVIFNRDLSELIKLISFCLFAAHDWENIPFGSYMV
jgi:hypothetical protein